MSLEAARNDTQTRIWLQGVGHVGVDLLGTRNGTTYVFGKVPGSSTRYELGKEQLLVGRDAPDSRRTDGIIVCAGEHACDGEPFHGAACQWFGSPDN